jgi:hypothetical protein
MKVTRYCETCGKKFELYPSQLKSNAGRFCSRKCTKTGIKPSDPAKRFWSKVNKTEGCWNWTGAKHKFGYGAFNVQGKVYTTHVYSWFLAHGHFPPKGKEVMHLCDNPSCVNPNHLKLGTHRENMIDCFLKGRNSKGEMKSKLTEDEVKAIRALYKPYSKKYSSYKLAQIFKVSHQNISEIINNNSWKYI